MKKYQWVLFDADETLFHFDSFSGLKKMFALHHFEFTSADYIQYQQTNKILWQRYQNGTTTACELQNQRFSNWSDILNIPAHQLNSEFLAAMAEISLPIDGAMILLNALKDKVKLGIITNGFTELQRTRLHRTGLQNHFDILVVSEEVGFAKPHLGIFEYAMTHMGNPEPHQVLMVGDNLETDITGGKQAGFDTCWLNRDNATAPPDLSPTYHVRSLRELQNIFM